MPSNHAPSAYSKRVFYDVHDEEYIAISPEFPGSSGFGETEAEAITDLLISIEGIMQMMQDQGEALPEPRAPEATSLPSGEFRVRLPPELHAQLATYSRDTDTPQNTLVVQFVSEGLQRGRTWISEESPHASRAGERKFVTRRNEYAGTTVLNAEQQPDVMLISQAVAPNMTMQRMFADRKQQAFQGAI